MLGSGIHAQLLEERDPHGNVQERCRPSPHHASHAPLPPPPPGGSCPAPLSLAAADWPARTPARRSPGPIQYEGTPSAHTANLTLALELGFPAVSLLGRVPS